MRIVILAALALASCSEPAGDDGYMFDHADFRRSRVTVDIVEYQDLAKLQAAARALKPETLAGEQRQAFGRVWINQPRCEIHMLAPEKTRERKWPGHELLHCIYGDWHRRPPR
ncbi:hypothetical protein [Sphingobium boeckii]|uniref:Uncharacterized protein n=1 Tax=Sphingobium boeckii TaxID=1082345 RepID=A0A7W9AEU9_9SPHN|nr:hypothetical protein [Sphingobium boeckii]MBB5684283.1 hypothetical protein [Sphingobium boeckii]